MLAVTAIALVCAISTVGTIAFLTATSNGGEAIALVVLIAGGVTAALLKNTSNKITNQFYGGDVGCDVLEDVTTTPGVKKDVKVRNNGTATAYVRACVAVSWVDSNGNVYGSAPVEGVDYTVVKPSEWDWFNIGDVYYCKHAVAPSEATKALFTSVKPVADNTPEGYTLSVEILGNSIQSLPKSAVENDWDVTVESDGTLSGKGE